MKKQIFIFLLAISATGLFANNNSSENNVSSDSASSTILYSEAGLTNEITPNGDGINDFFRINNAETKNLEVKIYNRWGDVVFSTSKYQNLSCSENCWNGGNDGDKVYFYVIKNTGSNAKPIKGFVHVVR